MTYTKRTTPYGVRRSLGLPFGFSLDWGRTEFRTWFVWIGTTNGGIGIQKDHS
jgi:hypothetical protein